MAGPPPYNPYARPSSSSAGYNNQTTSQQQQSQSSYYARGGNHQNANHNAYNNTNNNVVPAHSNLPPTGPVPPQAQHHQGMPPPAAPHQSSNIGQNISNSTSFSYQHHHQQALPQQQQLSQPPPPPQQQQQLLQSQQQYNEQQELIAALRRQLEEKNEENFDLSANLAATQVETSHRLRQVEQANRQEVSKLQETLRRTQQEINFARSALRKEKAKTQHQTAATATVGVKPITVQPIAASSSVAHSNINNNNNMMASSNVQRSHHPKPATVTTNQAQKSAIHSSPSPRPKSDGSGESKENPPDAMIMSAPHHHHHQQQSNIMISMSSSPSTGNSLARYLLQTLPAEDSTLRQFLAHHATHQQEPSLGQRSQEEVVWGLVQQCIDDSSCPALMALNQALLWSREGCRSVAQAAGLELDDDNNNYDPMQMEGIEESDYTVVSNTSIRIRGTTGDKRQIRQLEQVARQLKQPLVFSSTRQQQTNMPLTTAADNMIVSELKTTTKPNKSLEEKFSLKHQQLARQLLTSLSDAIYYPASPPPNHHNQGEAPLFPRAERLRILVLLLSPIRRPPPLHLLEPAMRNIVSCLEHSRLERQIGLVRVRGYAPLMPLPSDDAMQVDDGQQDRQPTTTTLTTSSTAKNNKEVTTKVTVPMDPMLCELCRCIGNLYTSSESGGSIDTIAKREFVNQWRKASLACICDVLELRLLPLLLRLESRASSSGASKTAAHKKSIPIPSDHVLAAWQEWIPWFTTFIQDEPGRQLLRTQFPLMEVEISRRGGDGQTTKKRATANTSATSTNKSTIVVPQTHHQSTSAIGVIVALLHASVMLEQQLQSSQAGGVIIPKSILSLCQTIRDQSIRFFHAWLQCRETRKEDQPRFLSLVSEYLEFYKSACAWILHQYNITTNRHDDNNSMDISKGGGGGDDGVLRSDCKLRSSFIPADIITMIRMQMEDLLADEEEAIEDLEKRYSRSEYKL